MRSNSTSTSNRDCSRGREGLKDGLAGIQAFEFKLFTHMCETLKGFLTVIIMITALSFVYTYEALKAVDDNRRPKEIMSFTSIREVLKA